jgi:hypothetical protein
MATKIRPPRVPKNEALKVTILNQEKQIVLLIDRVEEVVKERDEFKRRLAMAEQIATVYERLLGWQDCAREILHGDQIQIGRT